MKKILLSFTALLFAVNALYAQNQAANPLREMDAAVKILAGDIDKRLGAERAPKIMIGQFSFRDSLPSLGSYWVNQLGEELTNIPGKTFTLLAGGSAGADWVISGEMVEIGAVIRVYTRLVRSSDRSVTASFHSDFERSPYLLEMLSGGSGGGRASGVARDAREPDSWEYPVSVEPGTGDSAPVTDRTLHNDEDEDFFLLQPAAGSRLVMETTGNIDTLMELYDADSMEQIAENDDGGSNNNARIRHNAEAGKRYLVKVRGYSGETGRYGFRAYVSTEAGITPDEYESDNDASSAKEIVIGTPQRHSFHNGDDKDWVKFQITSPGRYTIRARGVNSTRLDTRIELFDANVNSIDEDDDGGESYDSRLSLRLESGLYYLKADCLDNDPEEPYTISIRAD